MMGHYLRVQEAASLLGVAPTTIRWYCAQEWLPTYWVGRGQVGHRRFLYADVEALGKRLGRVIPPEKDWNTQSEWDVHTLAEYLGLSTKFLIGLGVIQTGQHFTQEEVRALERTIYGNDHSENHEMEDETMEAKDHDDIRDPRHNPHMVERLRKAEHARRREMHPFAHGRGPWFGPGPRGQREMAAWGTGADWFELDNIDPTNLLALRRALRHLETRKLDLEDQIAELRKKIEMHPDYEED